MRNWLIRVAEHQHAIPVVCGSPELAGRVIGGMGLHVVSIEAWPTDDRLFPVAMSINADRVRLAQMARERISHGNWWAPTSPRYTPPEEPDKTRPRKTTRRPTQRDKYRPKPIAAHNEHQERKFSHRRWSEWSSTSVVSSSCSLIGAAPPWRRSLEMIISPLVPFCEMQQIPTNAWHCGDDDDEWFKGRHGV